MAHSNPTRSPDDCTRRVRHLARAALFAIVAALLATSVWSLALWVPDVSWQARPFVGLVVFSGLVITPLYAAAAVAFACKAVRS